MSSILEVRLAGHLREADLREALEAAMKTAEGSSCGMLFDCLGMTAYDMEARHAFVAWHRAHRGRVRAVAVVTEKMLWHMVVSAMAMASGQTMRAFAKREEAEAWLRVRLASAP